jgi:YidC/Oxa1 family membrane protein insertase
MSDVWYYAVEDKLVGPLSLAELTTILSRVSNAKDVLVWRTGFEQWQRAATVAELAAFVIKPPKPPPLPPPLPRLPPNLQSDPSMVHVVIRDHEHRPKHRKIRLDRIGLTKSPRNIIAAIALSLMVVIGWQYFIGYPQMERQRQEALLKQQQQTQPAAIKPSASAPVTQPPTLTREAVIAASPRITIDTPRLRGSVDLTGGRIDDLSLEQYRETVDPNSPPIVLLSPSGAPDTYYAEFGWVPASRTTEKMPGPDTVWKQEGSGALGIDHPVTLTYDNGEGLIFRRTIAVDDHYLFTIRDEVANKSSSAVTLFPYALISRHGTATVQSHYIFHEGLIGVMGDQGLQEETYKKIADKKSESWDVTDAWLGFTDKYWAAVLLPDTDAKVRARFSAGENAGLKLYQTDYLLQPQTIAPGATGSADARLFAGAKEVSVVGINFPLPMDGGYNEALGLNHFDLLIDWGWFYFFTKPMFYVINYFNGLVGNFGVAILIFATIIKIIFVPFANRSYRSMIKMQRLQPQITALRERFSEQEQANKEIIELYKRENVTAPSGCLPIVIQTFLYFTLYKVLFVTVEMRYAPFFGWIHDLSAPDSSNVFNLFGLIPFEPATVPLFGSLLHLGVLPIILGLTVWQLQQNISPIGLSSFQRWVYAVLPFFVIYGGAGLMAGMLIYVTWFNIMSIFHQLLLMNKEKVVAGKISEYSTECLPYGKIQPVVFLMMLAANLQNVLMVLVFWRRSKGPTSKKGETIQLKHDDAVNAEFPNALNNYLYRVEKDGTVSAVNGLGERVQFRNWRSFWEAAHPQE